MKTLALSFAVAAYYLAAAVILVPLSVVWAAFLILSPTYYPLRATWRHGRHAFRRLRRKGKISRQSIEGKAPRGTLIP